MQIQEYRTAEGATVRKLDETVNRLIKEGFQPFGSPYSIGKAEGNVDAPMCQAMIKLNKPEPAATFTPFMTG